ncbi:MAG TPA: ATP-dependent protease ATPase subunit HslU [Candidatus Hydrogenedentes bacterium]|nr:ATP-dependent protease ATPase subunit HslU [Candidatus Hydrogenedentota bacterium]HOV73851.1 ATP-dependent protease ATPase subunit HslU [Candidatus Hydrogenedentota bacterium]HPC14926.1 ATP-dependent protease ATPase subunit HslU [Candidatus Hydrogenedentota bacterium]HRT18790.1 ATP-dependent protease ATPase subunit HslU [Candidatus Hydrogenedentota bacterium]HRT65764.1 ATP-dependent protease ATPase subunit HslU [Candidatus Hydrogenedentota bacterium]
MQELTPRQIVEELDKYIVGQDNAKRKVAIALRNRWRRLRLSEDLRDEVAPKNIIMIGPTGVGKTEIARRLARLADAPFIKVEASKFTEVGYVGRDCESMIRELLEVGVGMVREEMKRERAEEARQQAEQRLLDVLLPPSPPRPRTFHPMDPNAGDEAPVDPNAAAEARVREVILGKLRAGELESREIEIEVRETAPTSMMQVFSNSGLEEMGVNVQEMFGRLMPPKTKRRKVSVAEARRILEQEALGALIDMETVVAKAIERTENAGIVFLDEIDKIAGRSSPGHGPDVSREGVQRDILPIVEGSTVVTKHGPVRTDHILFIAAGAFHMTKVSDLIPELQGRFPIRVELDSLHAAEFSRILREPRNSLIKQYQALLETEGVTVEFEDAAIEAIARISQNINEATENIGARRLHTVMEYLLEDISFEGPEAKGRNWTITAAEVESRLAKITESRDLGRYIL